MPESNEPSTQSVGSRPPAEPGSAPGAPAGPARPPLRPGRVLAGAARTGRRDAGRILGVAILIALATVLAEIVADHVVDPHRLWQAAIAGVITEGIGLLGTVFLSGFVCRLTGRADPGGEPVTLGHVLRTLPWGRLVAADLLVVLLTVAGLVALVVPGLIIVTLLTVVGPVIEIEDRPVRGALRRSARLVRPYFWRVALLATVPIVVVSQLESAGPEPTGAPEIAEALAVRGVAGGLAEAVISLILVQLCYRLIALDAVAAASRAERHRAAGAA